MAASDLVYPFSTQDGKAIPLDIINPEALIIQAFTAEADSEVGPVTGLDIAVFIASKPCLVRFSEAFPNPPVDGTSYSEGLIVPSGVTVTVQCPDTTFFVRGTQESGTLYVQLVRRWAGLALPRQFTHK